MLLPTIIESEELEDRKINLHVKSITFLWNSVNIAFRSSMAEFRALDLVIKRKFRFAGG